MVCRDLFDLLARLVHLTRQMLIYGKLSGFITDKNPCTLLRLFLVLIKNAWFVDFITGDKVVINSLRYIMLGIMSLYLFPALITLAYKKSSYLIEIIFSTFPSCSSVDLLSHLECVQTVHNRQNFLSNQGIRAQGPISG